MFRAVPNPNLCQRDIITSLKVLGYHIPINMPIKTIMIRVTDNGLLRLLVYDEAELRLLKLGARLWMCRQKDMSILDPYLDDVTKAVTIKLNDKWNAYYYGWDNKLVGLECPILKDEAKKLLQDLYGGFDLYDETGTYIEDYHPFGENFTKIKMA